MIEKIALKLFEELECNSIPLRLIGISVSNIINKCELNQLTLVYFRHANFVIYEGKNIF